MGADSFLKCVFLRAASRWQQVTFLWGTKGGDRRSLEGGRGADTSSCGTIALQRKCDTLPVISPRTRTVSGRAVTDGQHQMKVSKNGPCKPPHTNFIYQPPPYLPADGLSSYAHPFIESMHWQPVPVMHFRVRTPSVSQRSREFAHSSNIRARTEIIWGQRTSCPGTGSSINQSYVIPST